MKTARINFFFSFFERKRRFKDRKKRLKTTNWRRLKSLVTKLSVELKRAYAWKFFFIGPEFFWTVLRNFRFISTIETIGGFILTNDACTGSRKFRGFDSVRWKKAKSIKFDNPTVWSSPTTFYIIPNTFS